MLVFTILIVILTLVLETTISVLNYRRRSQPIPENVRDVYDSAQYKRWLDYTMETHRLAMFSRVFNTGTLIAMLLFNGFPFLAQRADDLTGHEILRILVFLGMVYLLQYILNLGFKLYRTFGIESRYGFNATTPRVFVQDQIKSVILGLLLGGGLLYCLLWLYFNLFEASSQSGSGSAWIRVWLVSWLLIVLVTLIVNLLYTKVFIRLFNTLTPLRSGPLYDQIVELAVKTGYAIKEISVMDASRRSTRLNAFFSGFGRFKHIVLYDTLIEKCGTEEVVAILAHEIGHAKHKDVLKNFLLSVVQIGATLALLLFFLTASGSWAPSFGFSTAHLGFALLHFGMLTDPLGFLLGIPLTAISRKAEYAADGFASSTTSGPAMIRALKTLARENFSNLTPHPLAVKLTYTHPPISQRIEAIARLDGE